MLLRFGVFQPITLVYFHVHLAWMHFLCMLEAHILICSFMRKQKLISISLLPGTSSADER